MNLSDFHNNMIVIDGLQYSNWNRQIFEQLRDGGGHDGARDHRLSRADSRDSAAHR